MNIARKVVAILSLVVCPLSTHHSYGQSPETRPEFEVASVKPHDPRGRSGTSFGSRSPGTFSANDANLRFLIQQAYGVNSSEIFGGPSWINTDTFDIEAKPRVNTDGAKLGQKAIDEMVLMLQPLLEDRFKLTLHRETRELPVYFLTVAKGGHKMHPPNCTPNFDDRLAAGSPVCPTGLRAGNHAGNRTLDGLTANMPVFLKTLTLFTGRKIIDKTELTGRFDFHLEWAPDPQAGVSQGDSPKDATGEPTGPSLSTALQEQLGLKIESGRAPLEVLVIDRVEKPEAN